MMLLTQELCFMRQSLLLEQLLLEHPYFQCGQLLFAKGLLNTDSMLYNRQLKKAAAYSFDRKKLFELIVVNSVKKAITNKIVDHNTTKEEKLELGKPLDFDEKTKASCPYFVGRYFRNLTNCDSPEWLQRKLNTIGLRPISALVDITNLITFASKVINSEIKNCVVVSH